MNLANCKPSEFLRQSYRIKKSVEKWLKDTDIINIKKEMPKLTPLTKEMTEAERKEVFEANRIKVHEQTKKNAMAILDAVLDAHADETLEILALCCFVEPNEVDNYTIDFYLNNFTEIINNKAVIDFFISLAQLGQINIPNAWNPYV